MKKKHQHKWVLIEKRIKDNFPWGKGLSTLPSPIKYWKEYEFYCEKCGEIKTKKLPH
jgi:hypothetical protein